MAKSALRVEAFGSVDELNAHLGLLRAGIERADDLPSPVRTRWSSFLGRIQGWLLEAGAVLAAPGAAGARGGGLPAGAAAEVEQAIDALEAGLPALRSFILPGGGILGAQAHVARTVARRAERRVVALHGAEPVPPELLAFLNRLSDYLFVLARALNGAQGAAEEPWHPASPRRPRSTDSQS